MNRILLFLFCLNCISCSYQKNEGIIESTPKKLWEQEGFIHPESVVYSKEYDCLFISNIGNSDSLPRGFISKVAKTGTIINLRWCDSLFEPKGIALFDRFLYVTDCKQLVKIDLSTGRKIASYTNRDIQFLNDATSDMHGNIYVSDMFASSIYILDTIGRFELLFHDSTLHHPNGLWFENEKLYIGSWGRLDNSKTDEDSIGKFLVFDIATQKLSDITTQTIGKLDGIQKKENHFLVSSWKSGELYNIAPDGNYTAIFRSEESVGDILYNQEQKLLVLPLNFQNKVVAYSF